MEKLCSHFRDTNLCGPRGRMGTERSSEAPLGRAKLGDLGLGLGPRVEGEWVSLSNMPGSRDPAGQRAGVLPAAGGHTDVAHCHAHCVLAPPRSQIRGPPGGRGHGGGDLPGAPHAALTPGPWDRSPVETGQETSWPLGRPLGTVTS